MPIRKEDRELYDKLCNLKGAIEMLVIGFIVQCRSDPQYAKHESKIVGVINQLNDVDVASWLSK